jgi:deoxyribodipyrimidine photo-lyase
MTGAFTTDYPSILQKIDLVDPIQYSKTRNYTNGAVTYLSPYISRGVISTKQVLDSVLEKGYKIQQIEPFVKELCWRDYFQRVGQHKDLNQDIRQKQEPVLTHEIPDAIINASTGIEGIDKAIEQLYLTGYMHNHCRMYTASLVCNIAKAYWQQPAQWMYYHLLDGDWASNTCSWQWVAGANSQKKYFANQENINKYTFTHQQNSFLDHSYEVLESIDIPASLLSTQKFVPEYYFPTVDNIELDNNLPVYIYNYYNLDPLWHKGEEGNRILLLEPDFFSRYPISKICRDFMLELSKNIPSLQVYTGSFHSFADKYAGNAIYFKEHPLNIGYKGIEEPREWICPHVTDYYASFFSYWKRVEKQLNTTR